ncbi:hypothetical protein LC040_02165 [Bacillus tianshenii]|nr:hypothetical protein LC040_02165 [Bacillus tianshenii]
MNLEKLQTVPLDQSFELIQGFSCGNDHIDGYLQKHYMALEDHIHRLAKTTTFVADNEIIGFVFQHDAVW